MGSALKPQDVVVALRLAAHPAEPWDYAGLGQALGMSSSTVHQSIGRLKACRLYNPVARRAVRRNLVEFVLHGLPYTFPAEEGLEVMGVPTAWSASPLADRIQSDASRGAVWPSRDGAVRGHAIPPLYESVPAAAARDPALYELLALVDAIRAGRARERALAKDEFARRLGT